DSAVRDLSVGENVEREGLADKPSIPFMISVDGETVDRSVELPKPQVREVQATPDRPVDLQRKTDLGLAAIDIQVKFDGLDAPRLLNISTVSMKRTYRAGEEIEFLATSNYPAFIERAEIRIHDLSGREPRTVA